MVAFTTIGYLAAYFSGAPVERCRSVAVLIFIGISLVVLIRVSIPITKIKFILILTMTMAVAICYTTSIGKMVFSLDTITLREFIMAAVFTVVSWPLISLIVVITQRIQNRRNKIQVG